MASASVIHPDPAPQPPFRVDLNLSKEEAYVVLAIMRNVGGLPDRSYRGTCDSINSALQKVGLNIYSDEYHAICSLLNGAINFSAIGE